MRYLNQIPLGKRVPDSPHSVCVSLPTLEDVIGYEEKNPKTLSQIRSGYPRFYKHYFISEVEETIQSELKIQASNICLLASPQACQEAMHFANCPEAKADLYKGIDFVIYPKNRLTAQKFKNFVQHTGTGISSRHAEDFLVKTRKLNRIFNEKSSTPLETTALASTIAQVANAEPENTFITSSGMNAFYGTFKAIQKSQKRKARKVWIQLGWLYTDTIKILETYLEEEKECILMHDVFDYKKLVSLIENRWFEIAGIVTEIPTNPLIQSSDIAGLYQLCKSKEIALILDPTIASIYNVDVLKECDVLVTSLTKYAANQGDVMAGCVILNPESTFYEELNGEIQKELTPLYIRDQSRLMFQALDAPKIVNKINQNTQALVHFLEKNKNIESLYWSRSEKSKKNFDSFSKDSDSVGGLITLSVKNISLKKFYDKIKILKSPSFGTYFSLICPFMYLAHYDLVNNPEGRAYLKNLGIDPDLIRVSVGSEKIEEILAIFKEALE